MYGIMRNIVDALKEDRGNSEMKINAFNQLMKELEKGSSSTENYSEEDALKMLGL